MTSQSGMTRQKADEESGRNYWPQGSTKKGKLGEGKLHRACVVLFFLATGVPKEKAFHVAKAENKTFP